jgi:hypothetical protein
VTPGQAAAPAAPAPVAKISSYADPGIKSPGSITSAPDGALWFTNETIDGIGRITTAGAITIYHSSVPLGFLGQILPGPDGTIWFIRSNGSGNVGISRIGMNGAFIDGVYGPTGGMFFPIGIAPAPDNGSGSPTHASAAAGFKVGVWSDGCKASDCRVVVRANQHVQATFDAKQKTIALTISTLSVTGHYQGSQFTGNLDAAGTVASPTKLSLSLGAVGTGKHVTLHLSLGAGSFAKAIPLPPNLAPGQYAVVVSGTGRAPVPQQVRTVTVAAPPLGLLANAWIAAARAGPKVTQVRGPTTELWAYFHFAVPLGTTAPLKVTWYAPTAQAGAQRSSQHHSSRRS